MAVNIPAVSLRVFESVRSSTDSGSRSWLGLVQDHKSEQSVRNPHSRDAAGMLILQRILKKPP